MCSLLIVLLLLLLLPQKWQFLAMQNSLRNKCNKGWLQNGCRKNLVHIWWWSRAAEVVVQDWEHESEYKKSKKYENYCCAQSDWKCYSIAIFKPNAQQLHILMMNTHIQVYICIYVLSLKRCMQIYIQTN